jgi:pilus assembly protein CpaC
LVRLRVNPEVSEPDYTNALTLTGYVVPGLTQRRVDTVVELAPGQTLAIGGLLSEHTRGVSSKVPALGDLPVLGALFSSQSYQDSETELVVMVTPELVAPLNPGQAAYIPGSDHIPPNDWELFGLGKLDGEGGGRSGVKAEGATATDAGHGSKAGDSKGQAADGHRPAASARLRGPIGPAAADEGR